MITNCVIAAVLREEAPNPIPTIKPRSCDRGFLQESELNLFIWAGLARANFAAAAAAVAAAVAAGVVGVGLGHQNTSVTRNSMTLCLGRPRCRKCGGTKNEDSRAGHL